MCKYVSASFLNILYKTCLTSADPFTVNIHSDTPPGLDQLQTPHTLIRSEDTMLKTVLFVSLRSPSRLHVFSLVLSTCS